MRLGAFLMPSHPPERSVAEGQRLDLAALERLDRYGFYEAWIGEHFTSAWEPCPAPDLLVAQALLLTRTIRLGPLGHLLPYHNPVELAHRIAYLDHLSNGRLSVGIGISALPTDHQLFGLDVTGGRNRRMTFESLDIMESVWDGAQKTLRGEFWTLGSSDGTSGGLGPHLLPFQKPHPPIAIAALTAGSENHKLAGEKGYIPVSLSISPEARMTAGHWDAVTEGAARSGRDADRKEWRIIQDVYVASTDEDARSRAKNGMMGRCWREFLLPLYFQLGLGPMLKIDPALPDEAVDLDYLCDHLWLVGSPVTVARRINRLQEITGGFGVLLIVCYDSRDEDDAWDNSLKLLKDEVMPLCEVPLSATDARWSQ